VNYQRANESEPPEVRPIYDHDHPVDKLSQRDLPLWTIFARKDCVITKERLSSVTVRNVSNINYRKNVDHSHKHSQSEDLVVVRFVEHFELTGKNYHE
jgi:hypothetical protein